jgi:hypothetical protein
VLPFASITLDWLDVGTTRPPFPDAEPNLSALAVGEPVAAGQKPLNKPQGSPHAAFAMKPFLRTVVTAPAASLTSRKLSTPRLLFGPHVSTHDPKLGSKQQDADPA